MAWLDHIPVAVALGVMVTAVICEYRTTRVPNSLTLPTVVTGFVLLGILHGTGGLADALAGSVAAGAPMFLLFRREWLGGGSVKLTVALGTLLGLHGALVLVSTILLVFGLLFLRYRRARLIHRPSFRGTPVVSAGAVLGSTWVLLHGHGLI